MEKLVIHVKPSSSLIDEKVDIIVAGLDVGQRITLHARLVGDKGEVFESHAHLIADKHGQVDVGRDPSVSGSYNGVSAMGLLWSMKPAPGQSKGMRLMKSDVTKPYNVVLNCFDGHLNPQESSSSQPLSSKTFERWYMADGVKRIPVKEGNIRGTLFLPPGDGPFPGVIDLFGGAGGLVEFKASLLASHGFAALALAYFAYDDLPVFLSVLTIDYFEKAANWLVNHPKVLPHGVGVHAICYGSYIALLLASLHIKPVKAIVAISPLVTSFALPFQYKGRISDVIPFISNRMRQTQDGSIWRDAIPTDEGYAGPPASKYSAITQVENISCPVLLVSGTDDLNVNTDFSVKFILDRLKENGREHLCTNLRYPGAGHLLEPPHSPFCYTSHNRAFQKDTGIIQLVFGGEMKAHSKAQEDAWPKILSFLQKNLHKVQCCL